MMAYPPPPPWAVEMLTAAVTGTNGKSSTVNWIAAALRAIDRATPSITTVGAAIGVEPWPLPGDHDGVLDLLSRARARGARHAALEATSAVLAVGFAKAWPCTVAVFTNLSVDHLDLHRTAEHYLASKAQLFVHLRPGGTAVLNGDDPASDLIEEVVPAGVTLWRYGGDALRARRGIEPDLAAVDVVPGLGGTRASLQAGPALRGMPSAFTIDAVGEAFVENALGALAAAVACGVPPDVAAQAIAGARALPGRFEVVSLEPTVVVDYAHSPDALRRTLATARLLAPRRLVVVFGAGGDRQRDKRAPMGREAARADVVVVTSDNPRSEQPAAIAADIAVGLRDHPDVRIILDRRAAIAEAIAVAGAGDIVVVCGRGHELSQIVGSSSRPFSDADTVRDLLGLVPGAGASRAARSS